MKNAHPDGLGQDFPGPIARVVLRLLIPIGRREELVGDLIEEAETVVLPTSDQRTARGWFWRQAITSASPLYARRATKEVEVNRWKWIFVVILLIAGPVMALDPTVLGATPGVIALVALAILIPAAVGLVSGNIRALAGAAVVSACLLLAARLASGIEIRWYAMAFMFFVILNLGRLVDQRFGKQTSTS